MPKSNSIFNCMPCFPKKRNRSTSSVPIPCSDDTGDGIIWKINGTGYSRRQVSKAVAIVLTGYDPEVAANAVDEDCDSDTINQWVTMYRPPFYEDGMSCPPALILWWIKEMERRDRATNSQLNYDDDGRVVVYGQTTLLTAASPYTGSVGTNPDINVQQLTSRQKQIIGQQNSISTGYNPQPPPVLISSPTSSQPNVRVFYQDGNASINASNPNANGLKLLGSFNNTNSGPATIGIRQSSSLPGPGSPPLQNPNQFPTSAEQNQTLLTLQLQQAQAEKALAALQKQAANSQQSTFNSGRRGFPGKMNNNPNNSGNIGPPFSFQN